MDGIVGRDMESTGCGPYRDWSCEFRFNLHLYSRIFGAGKTIRPTPPTDIVIGISFNLQNSQYFKQIDVKTQEETLDCTLVSGMD
jgi:hypothetical protein